MFRFVLEKMLHKKWMMICLLIGNILLIGIAVCNPMYYHAAIDKMMKQKLDSISASSGVNAGTVFVKCASTVDRPTSKVKVKTKLPIYNAPYRFGDMIEENFGLPASNKVCMVTYPSSTATVTDSNQQELSYSLINTPELQKHAKIVSGDWFTDSTDCSKVIDCVISEKTLVSESFMIGQQITLNDTIDDKTGKPIVLRIAGVFSPNEEDDYWSCNLSDYKKDIFISDEFSEYVKKNVTFHKGTTVSYYLSVVLDYSKISTMNVEKVKKASANALRAFKAGGGVECSVGFYDTIKDFISQNNSIHTIMFILQIPMLLLLAAFIFMVTKQMLDMETNEIAVMKSRGVSRKQLLSVYLVQSGVIVLISTVLGVPLGLFLTRVIGASNSFMEFVNRRALTIHFSMDIIWYWLAAVAFSILVMIIPVIKASRLTIVEYKQNKKAAKPIWQKFFLDIILLAAAGYSYYSYSQQKDTLAEKIALTGKIDPLLFLGSAFFILGIGLFIVRIFPGIVWIIYQIGKKKWSPSLYASFLQIIRTGSRQSFISVFLILTISFGIYNATMARTVNKNGEDNICYNNGADVVLSEEFSSNEPTVRRMKASGTDVELKYSEPDFYKYSALNDCVESYTKVFKGKGTVSFYKASGTMSGSSGTNDITIMGINPKEFGETTWFRDDLSKTHWFNQLNLLAENPNGFLVTNDLKKQLGLSVGDSLYFILRDKLDRTMFDCGIGTVVGFVDYWPSYTKKVKEFTSDDDFKYTTNNIIIGNFNSIMSQTDVQPYSVYMKTKGDTQKIYDFVAENKLDLNEFKDTKNDLVEERTNPLFQVSNGLLTISFIVVLILCGTGFLIYWILSIRSRELLFGIYRAMGLSKRELFSMLVNEHVFSTLLSILAGVGVGVVASHYFVPMVQVAYANAGSTIPMLVVTSLPDMIRLGAAVFLMIAICIYVLTKLLSRLNISQALKLGED